MNDVLQYVVVVGVMTLVVKIVYDWLKNRGHLNGYVTKRECKVIEDAVALKLEMIMEKITKIEERLDRLYEKLSGL